MALRHLALANRNWDQIRSTLEIKLRASYHTRAFPGSLHYRSRTAVCRGAVQHLPVPLNAPVVRRVRLSLRIETASSRWMEGPSPGFDGQPFMAGCNWRTDVSTTDSRS